MINSDEEEEEEEEEGRRKHRRISSETASRVGGWKIQVVCV